MVKNDLWIKTMGKEHRIIEPFEPSLVKTGKISFGPSSFGYDFRLGNEFLRFVPPSSRFVIDPKDMKDDMFEALETDDPYTIPANSLVLARSLETFRIPRDILGVCTGKSTYSRCGVLVNITPLEPEWEGQITFPILNTNPLPVRVYPGEGIGQVLFLQGPAPETSYADRKGKYQAQKGVTVSKI